MSWKGRCVKKMRALVRGRVPVGSYARNPKRFPANKVNAPPDRAEFQTPRKSAVVEDLIAGKFDEKRKVVWVTTSAPTPKVARTSPHVYSRRRYL